MIPNIVTPVLERVALEDKRYPCRVNRASSLGYFVPSLGGCLRRGVYERTNWQDKEPWGGESLLRFREGNRQEEHVLADLTAAGVRVIEQQATLDDPKYQLSGHIDGVILGDDGERYILEIKSCSPNIWSQISDIESLQRKPWLRAYTAQMCTYLILKELEWGIFIFKDKSSGLLKQLNVPLDYELGEDCLQTCEAINGHVAKGTLPKPIDNIDKCSDCPFKIICLPDRQWGIPMKIEDDPQFERRLDEYYELEDAGKRAKDLWSQIRSRATETALGGRLNLVVGKYHLSGKTDARGALRLSVERV